MKNKGTTTILAGLLGGIGIHRFYLGQTWAGIFCILFCWTTIPFWIGVIDFLVFAFMSEKTFNEKYNADYMRLMQNVQGFSAEPKQEIKMPEPKLVFMQRPHAKKFLNSTYVFVGTGIVSYLFYHFSFESIAMPFMFISFIAFCVMMYFLEKVL
jgi:TM2 domain-containing membrane protein YozV